MLASTLLALLPLGHAAPVTPITYQYPVSPSLQNILDDTTNSDLYSYPTQLTQGIVPKPIHSHNDYWRPRPFYTALSVGAISIEADVWLANSTLYVGHERAALTESRTLSSLYITPILSALQTTNPQTPFVDTTAAPNGVYDTSSGQTLYLFIDLKTPGDETWPFVVSALAPLREAGYLTTYNGTAITPGPVTVIGTGNTPQSNFTSVSESRDYFFDANLALLNDTQSNITSNISPIASCSFGRYVGEIEGGALNETQKETLKGLVDGAAEKGILARFWDTPGWPVMERNAVWRELWDAGTGLLNADDLVAAAGFIGSTDGSW
jgi:hypothetical protein